MSPTSILLMLLGIAVVQFHRARRVIRAAEEFQGRVRTASLMPFELYDEPS